MRILVSAYACEPGKGSEPYVGWSLPTHLARYRQVYLLTRANNRDLIEAELRKQPLPNLQMIYFDLPKWARFWKKGTRGIHLYYYLWQIGAYWHVRRLHREVPFDIVHHLTFGIDWVPSFLSFLPATFVWGPLVGAEPVAASFRRTFSVRARAQETVRAWIRGLSRLDPMMRRTARRSVITFTSGAQLRDHLQKLGCRTVLMYPSVGISRREIEDASCPRRSTGDNIVRFLCVGNLFAFRAFSSTIQAFGNVHQLFPNTELWFAGDGPERQTLASKVQELGITDAVTFWGAVPRGKVLSLLSQSDVLVYPCLRGAVSMACMEAMAAGVPVISLDIGGTSLQVTEDCGIKIPARTPGQLKMDLEAAMRRLVADPEGRRRMGENARQRVVREFSWDAKAEYIYEIYAHALRDHCQIPGVHSGATNYA